MKLFRDNSQVVGQLLKQIGFDMDSTSGFKCVICYDSVKHQSIHLRCGHAFGKTCMRKWVESSKREECLLCKNPLTDDEVNEIKSIPLSERAVIITEKTIKLFGQTIFKFVRPFAIWTPVAIASGVAIGAATTGTAWFTTVASRAAAGGTVAWSTAVAAGVAVGAVCAAAGVDRDTAKAFGASAGAVCTFLQLAGGFGITASAAGAVGITAGALGVTATAIQVTAEGGGITAGTAGAIGVAIGSAGASGVAIGFTGGAIGFIGGVAGGAIGTIGANVAYDEQQVNPVIV